MLYRVSLLAAVGLYGCAEEPQTIVAYPAPIHYETRIYTGTAPPAAALPPTEARPAPPEPSRQRMLVLQTHKLDRPSEVVGIVDAHEDGGREELALDELRRKAAALGADAVVGVDFHHAEAAGQPLHLSGLAVRYVSGSAQ